MGIQHSRDVINKTAMFNFVLTLTLKGWVRVTFSDSGHETASHSIICSSGLKFTQDRQRCDDVYIDLVFIFLGCASVQRGGGAGWQGP